MIPSTAAKKFRRIALLGAVLMTSCCTPSKQQETQATPSISSKAVACRSEGQSFEGKSLGEACCAGLTPVDSTYPSPQGTCMRSAPPSVMVCARCGDGVCGTGENWCNCPADCKKN